MGPKRAPPDPELDPATAAASANRSNNVATTAQHPPSLPLPSPQPLPTTADFSPAVKRKLSSSSRTGQACDRCKRRKIKCDRNPSGCTPCAQNRTQCHTTDRISGVPIPRGHVQQLEAQIHYLQQLVGELQVQVKELGGEPRVHPTPFNAASPPPWNATNTEGDMHGWGAEADRASVSPSPGYATTGTLGTSAEGAPLPEFKRGSIGDNYVGVSSADSLLSHIKGTSLSVFGTEIDITDFVEGAGEEDYEKSPMSYENYLKVAFNIDPVEEISFPDYQHLRQYAFWYLRSLNPYTMLLDRPTFVNLITRIGTDPTFKPSVAETAQVHIMLAMIKYQFSLRNKNTAMMEESHKHYRYASSMFPQLYLGHDLEDLQAMTMICVHLRGFAKPGAAWIMCSTTFQLAVEFGLHRSHSAWAETGRPKTAIEVEMRKRIFWTLHALAVSLSGKLGRPMPIAWADMDVEFPEPVSDSLPGDEPAKCSFRVGIETVKISVIISKLYRTIYAVRQSAHHYERTVKQLEKEAQEWKDRLPYDLAEGGRAGESHIHALYLDFWNQQFQLLLHHPAVCRSTDPNFISSNLDKCLAASSRILKNCDELRKHNSLDTPWINSVMYIAAIFTTLFIYHQRRDRLSSEDISDLTTEMSLWLEVMGECGRLIGTGDKLKTALQRIIVPSLNSISDHVHKKTTEAVARAALVQAPQDSSQAVATYGNGNAHHEAYPNAVAGPPVATGRAAYVASDTSTVNPPSNMYAVVQTNPSFGYNNGASAGMTVYPPTSSPFDQSSFHVADDAALSAAHANALASAASGGPGQRTQSFMYGDTSGTNNGHPVPYPVEIAGPTGWTSWSKTFMPSARLTGEYGPPPEFLNTANTLMSLGGRDAGSAQDPGVVSHDQNNVDVPMQTSGLQRMQWPENLFNILPNGHAG